MEGDAAFASRRCDMGLAIRVAYAVTGTAPDRIDDPPARCVTQLHVPSNAVLQAPRTYPGFAAIPLGVALEMLRAATAGAASHLRCSLAPGVVGSHSRGGTFGAGGTARWHLRLPA